MSAVAAALTALLRVDAVKRARDLYRAFDVLFERIGQDSGLLNLGLFEDPAAELHEAQRALARRVLEGLPRAGDWLDVGCGYGGVAAALVAAHPDLRVTGLDVREPVIDAARAQHRDPRLRFLVGDADALPFPYGSFDVLYSIDAAVHFRDRGQFAGQAWVTLRPGGRLALTDLVLRAHPSGIKARLAERLRFGAADAWRRHLHDAGFQDIEVIDLSEPVFAGLGRWVELLEREPDALPGPVRRAALAALSRLHEQGASGPLAYVLVRATRPAAVDPPSG
ncbi:MAG: methyltransferase domain-containing protein [Alphaproteobacteria bacterium]|nr:methyltransferase domain-containing protein [Alphaproteobacteria bacterium]